MTIVAVIFTPLVLVYQGWSYWVFRSRVVRPRQPPDVAATSDEGPVASVEGRIP
jgi:cytochrome d ubiquinol oxidase subunit II